MDRQSTLIFQYPGRSLPSAAPAGVGSPAPSSWCCSQRKAATAEEQTPRHVRAEILHWRGTREGVRGHNLGSQGLHAGLQVPEQVEALVEEGELSVDVGEHLGGEIRALTTQTEGFYLFKTLQRLNDSQSSGRRPSAGF